MDAGIPVSLKGKRLKGILGRIKSAALPSNSSDARR
jgi:hypothetical protein